MMGHSAQNIGYKIEDAESAKLVVSRDVIFVESSLDSLEVHIPPNEVSSVIFLIQVELVGDVDSKIEPSSDPTKESGNT